MLKDKIKDQPHVHESKKVKALTMSLNPTTNKPTNIMDHNSHIKKIQSKKASYIDTHT